MEVDVFEDTSGASPPLHVKLPARGLAPERAVQLKLLFEEFPGDSEVFLHLGEDELILRLGPESCVDTQNGLVGELRALLGPDSILV